jgi:hypothetical protein
MEQVIECPRCGWEIDPDTCHCGSGKSGHPYDLGHNFVPAGCTCCYADAENMKRVAGPL